MKKAAGGIIEKLRHHGYEAFFAGGWVRDYLLCRKSKDIDIATSALPDQVREIFPNSKPIGAQFGVIQVHAYGHAYEVATFRKDNSYQDGRHPSSVTFTNSQQDAQRRDFTINGLFYDPIKKKIIDYVKGGNDLRKKLIRTIGLPEERFKEDKLRMLRAVRFACSLDFVIVPETWHAIQALAPSIVEVSWERIRDELVKILTGPAPGKGLDMLHQSGILQHILPEVEQLVGATDPEAKDPRDLFSIARSVLSMLRRPSAALAFAALLQHAGTPAANQDSKEKAWLVEAICRRLKLSNDETLQILDLTTASKQFFRAREIKESALVRLLSKPNIGEHMELFRAYCLSSSLSLDLYRYCADRIGICKKISSARPLITGRDLLAMGYPPGPMFKTILSMVEDLQFEKRLKSKEEALAYVKSNIQLPLPQNSRSN